MAGSLIGSNGLLLPFGYNRVALIFTSRRHHRIPPRHKRLLLGNPPRQNTTGNNNYCAASRKICSTVDWSLTSAARDFTIERAGSLAAINYFNPANSGQTCACAEYEAARARDFSCPLRSWRRGRGGQRECPAIALASSPMRFSSHAARVRPQNRRASPGLAARASSGCVIGWSCLSRL